MNETERYKATLEMIRREAEMMMELKFGTPELEARMLRASILKMGLFAHNALMLHAPEPDKESSWPTNRRP